MRTSDPASYDDFKELTTATKLAKPFRALFFTHTGASVFTVSVGNYIDGSVQNKTITVNLTANTGSFLLPLSGDEVTITFSNGTCYALV
jgi:hypothetical protein